jgi:hypothetical protein
MAMTFLLFHATSAQAQLLSLGDVIANVNILNTQVSGITTQVTNNSSAIVNIQADVNALNDQTTANNSAIAQLNYDLTVVNAQIAANGTVVAAIDGRVGAIEAALPPLTGRVTALESSVAGLSATAAVNAAGIAANATVGTANTAAIAANNLRDDAQDVAIAANTGAIATLDGRVTAHDVLLAQHTADIAVATQTAVAAQTATATLRSDVAAGRIGLVQQNAAGLITVGAQTGGSEVSVAGTAGNRRISGVADGIGPSDAANVGQVAQSQTQAVSLANAYTDRSMASFAARMDDRTQGLIAQNNTVLRRDMNAAAASTAAIAGLPQSIVPGEGMGSIGIGGRGDAVAFAIGMSKAFKVDHTPIVRAGAALDARSGTLTYNASVGVHF